MKNQTESHAKLELPVQLRTEVGKQVKKLRRNGMLPANVYGSNVESKSVTVDLKAFSTAYKTAGNTGIVYLQLDKESWPTLITTIQRHPVDSSIVHVDFRKIDLKKKIETTVPVQVEGESPAVHQLGGVLLVQTDHLTVEALPEKIPAHIIIDVSTITELGQEIKVQDLATSSDYVIKEDPERVIVSVVEHKEESIEVENVQGEGPEILTGAKPEDGAEEAASEGEKAEEK